MADESGAPQIGPVLQKARKDRALTLERLAGASGVSKSMLSQIERGEANPTFAVLWSLTQALGVDLADLVQGASGTVGDSSVEVVTVAHTPRITSADHTCTLRILSPPNLAGRTEWYDVEIAPSGDLESAPHQAGTFEHFTALTDGMEVTSAGVTRSLRSGETARYAADVPHRISNTATAPARGLMVVLYR